MQSIKVAVCQMRSTEDTEANLQQAESLVHAAKADGAQLIALPENVPFLRIQSKENHAETIETGANVRFFQALARECEVAILLGSFQQCSDEVERVHNTSLLIAPDGQIAGKYEKIHLFDIDIPGSVTLKESDNVKPGTQTVVADLLGTRWGMSICYDLRFPELYRQLLDKGAEVLLVPAAFTLQTGKDHWEVLLRARAIENQCYLLAPGQWGHHGGIRNSYGNSMIIDPWGQVIARCSDGVGFVTARLDANRLREVRQNLPCADHRRIR